MSAQSRGFDERSKPAEIVWSHTLTWAPRVPRSVDWTRGVPQPRPGLAVNPSFTVSRTHSAWTAMSDDTTYLSRLPQLDQRLAD